MEKLPHIRDRIATLREFHEIVRALQAMAATHSRAAAAALEPSRAHLGVVRAALEAVLAPQGHDEAAGDAALVVLGSEHGFVGSLNEDLMARAGGHAGKGLALYLVGRRAVQVFAEGGLAAARAFSMASHVEAVPDLAGRLAASLSWAERLVVIHPRALHGGRVEVIETVAAMPPVRGHRALAGSRLDRPLIQLEPQLLVRRLGRELIYATLAHALIEALAAENTARLAAMQTADRNIRDKLASLTRTERVLRQEEITEELIDIVTGAEAVTATDASGEAPPGLAVTG